MVKGFYREIKVLKSEVLEYTKNIFSLDFYTKCSLYIFLLVILKIDRSYCFTVTYT